MPKSFFGRSFNKYTSNSWKGFSVEVDLEYPKELYKSHNDYNLASDKIEIKTEILSECQLKIAGLYNIPIGNLKKLVLNFFDKERYALHYQNLKLYLGVRLKLKRIHRVLNSINHIDLNHMLNSKTKKIRNRKNKDKDRKVLYKLMNNSIYRKTMENMRNRIDVKLVNNEKSYLKYTSNPSYISHKIFGNNLVAIRNTKVALKLNKPAFTGMCIKKLTKILLHEFLYDYIKMIYDNKSGKIWF